MRISDWSSDVCSSDLRVVVATADQPLDREERVFRIGDGLALGRLPDQPLAALGKGDHRGRRSNAFGVLDHLGLRALHDGDAGVRGAQVDRSEEHTSELQSLMRISYAVFCLKKKKSNKNNKVHKHNHTLLDRMIKLINNMYKF